MPAGSAIKEAKGYRDELSNVDKKSGKRKWIFAKKPSGKWYRRRTVVSILYIVFFFAGPLIKINGNPLVMLNFPERRFSILGIMFWPQDFFILGLGMLSFIIFIVLFTLAYGRAFCGWACPQTVFLEMIFRRIEYAIEGDYTQQKILDKQEWNSRKIFKKTLKHVLFFLVSFIIANTFLAYIIGKDALFDMMARPGENILNLILLLIFTTVFYAVFAFLREIVCINICPYGRLQGVLMDKKSILVAYDYKRGEPREKFKKIKAESAGDCIDCNQCVYVCPTGIDIRNGTQLECVNCTACIDACNFMMEKTGRPKGLIRYASEHSIATGEPVRFTMRKKVLTLALLAIIALMSFMIFTRSDIDATILRSKGQLFYELPGNKTGNLYTIKLTNKSREDIPIRLICDNPLVTIRLVGDPKMILPKESDNQLTFFVEMPSDKIKQRTTKMKIKILGKEKVMDKESIKFIGEPIE